QTFEYDGLGRTTKATDNNDPSVGNDDAVVQRSYDSLGRTQQECQGLGGITRCVQTEFNQDGSPIQVTYPNGRTVTIGRDGLERTNLIEDGPGVGTGPNIVPDSDPSNDIASYKYIG